MVCLGCNSSARLLAFTPEVDPNHIGVTGNSGGGTQTTWLCGLENRWTMAAPACFVTTIRRNVENELPQDTEQCPPNLLAYDLDHSDFLAAQAPRPVMILAQELDYFDARGAEEASSRLKKLYDCFGQVDNAGLTVSPSPHGYSRDNREAMYRFFNGVTRISDQQTEPTITIEKDETLFASPQGQVHVDPATRTIFSFTREKAVKLDNDRKKIEGAELLDAVRDVLRIPSSLEAPDYRILRGVGDRKYPTKNYCTYAVETEPGVHSLVTRLNDHPLMSRPAGGSRRAVLYVSHRSADAELRSEPLIKNLITAEPDAAFYAMDVRGIGESQPDICGKDQFLREYGSDYFLSSYSLMLGRPYLGQKTFDVVKVIQWLKDHGHSEVHLVGRGWGALPAAFASLLSQDVTQVTLKNALASYSELSRTEDYDWPYAVMLPNVLAKFDLPDVYRELESKRLHQIEPWGSRDGMKE